MANVGGYRVAILGSGNIGQDLLMKVLRSRSLSCSLFVGRDEGSPGLQRASHLGVPVSAGGIDALVCLSDNWDLVFDATSALAHLHHWNILERLGKRVIDLTPARVGRMCVPAVNLQDCMTAQNVNMVTCGGQCAIPLTCAIRATHESVEYVEVVSRIASRSAGPATRINLDEYIATTERAICQFSGSEQAKAILILNPAQPCIDMQTSIFARVSHPNIEALRAAIPKVVERVRQYVPDYELIVPPEFEEGRIFMMVRVRGRGDYLPKYAGNLDIINCAAIAVAEEHARQVACTSSSHAAPTCV